MKKKTEKSRNKQSRKRNSPVQEKVARQKKKRKSTSKTTTKVPSVDEVLYVYFRQVQLMSTTEPPQDVSALMRPFLGNESDAEESIYDRVMATYVSCLARCPRNLV